MFRGTRLLTIGATDEVLPRPAYIVASTAGDLTYEDMTGAEHTVTVAAGDIIHLGATAVIIPVFVVRIDGSSTVTQVIVGVL